MVISAAYLETLLESIKLMNDSKNLKKSNAFAAVLCIWFITSFI